MRRRMVAAGRGEPGPSAATQAVGLASRIRWGNVARLAAAMALVGLVAAWPRLAGRPPPVPATRAEPLASPSVTKRRAPRPRDTRRRATKKDRRRATRRRERATNRGDTT